MANRMVRVCDVCEAPAEGDPIKFGWGSGFYETDLCGEHGSALVGLMEVTIKNARQLGVGAPRKDRLAAVMTVRRKPVDSAAVRKWAKAKRIKVNPQGRIPESVIEQYLADTQSRGASS